MAAGRDTASQCPLLTPGEIKTAPWQLAKDHMDMGTEPLSRLWPVDWALYRGRGR